MDYFESIVKTLLEEQGYWCRQSFKVNVSREEKHRIGKPTIPRPEIDIVAFKPGESKLIALEAKSYLDSAGVRVGDLKNRYEIPTGLYKLFTCIAYREMVFGALNRELINEGLIDREYPVQLGLAAGKVHKRAEVEMRDYLTEQGIYFLGPSDLKKCLTELSTKAYENDPVIMASKILVRDT